jgi:hypothetical protein
VGGVGPGEVRTGPTKSHQGGLHSQYMTESKRLSRAICIVYSDH